MQMKLFILIIGLFASPLYKTETKVYVCLSGTAYAYHDNKSCRGLRQCTHEIVEVTIKYAVDSLRRRPCGYCY